MKNLPRILNVGFRELLGGEHVEVLDGEVLDGEVLDGDTPGEGIGYSLNSLPIFLTLCLSSISCF